VSGRERVCVGEENRRIWATAAFSGRQQREERSFCEVRMKREREREGVAK